MAKTAGELDPEVLDELLRNLKTEQDLNSGPKRLSKQLIERALEAMDDARKGLEESPQLLRSAFGDSLLDWLDS